MNDARDEIVRMLELEEVVEDRYVGQASDLGWGRLFGGHVLAQALSSASRTVQQKWLIHSLHAYFLRPGAVDAQVFETRGQLRPDAAQAGEFLSFPHRGPARPPLPPGPPWAGPGPPWPNVPGKAGGKILP